MTESIVKITATTSAKGVSFRDEKSGVAAHTFRGIPYAKPPVGDLRFCAPQPLALWSGERECTKHGPVCPQDMERSAQGHAPVKIDQCVTSEDCLYLNVTIPRVDPDARLPVMFWIHGGGFFLGMSDIYRGEAVCALNDVIMVTCNYRLGVLGFMCSGDDVIPGNIGFLDQVEALKWVKTHIAAFGGDPENITLFGESAGGMSAGFHIMSDMTRGLFARAICQSGVAACGIAIASKQVARAMIQPHLDKLGFEGRSSEDLLKFLRQKTPEELVKAIPGELIKPVVDGTFIVDTPRNLYKKGQFQHVPLITGINTHEGYMMMRLFGLLNPELPKQTTEDFRKVMQPMLMSIFHKNHEQLLDKLVDLYVKPGTLDDREKTLQSFCQFFGDLMFDGPQRFTVVNHSKVAPTYAYLFAKRPPFSTCLDWVVADHGNDIFYMLGAPFADFEEFTEFKCLEESKDFSKMMMTYWTNFAKTGDPNGPGLETWPVSSSPDYEYLILNDKPERCTDYASERLEFWVECDGQS